MSHGVPPPAQGDPPSTTSGADAAEAVANPANELTAPKLSEGKPDRTGAKVPPGGDTRRHDRDHRTTRQATEAPDAHHDEPSGLVHRETSSNLPVAKTVPDDLQTPARRASAAPAPRASRRANPIRRRHPLRPKLDLDIRMNDMTPARASRHLLQSTTRRWHASSPILSAELARCSASERALLRDPR